MNLLAKNLKFLRKGKKLTQAVMASQLGFEYSTYNNYELGRSNPTISDLLQICKILGVLSSDLLERDIENVGLISKSETTKNSQNVGLIVGLNVGLKSKNEGNLSFVSESGSPDYTASKMPQVITMDSQGNENVVMVPVKARAGYLNGYADPKFIKKLPAYRLPGLNNGTFRLFEVGGRSMYPTLHDGDMVIGSFVEQLRDVRDDRVYVVVTKTEGVVVKRVLNRLEKDGKLILKSDNYKDRDEFPTMVVDPHDILEIWYVTGFISRQMRPPAEMYNRLIDLEGRLTLIEEQNRKRLKEN